MVNQATIMNRATSPQIINNISPSSAGAILATTATTNPNSTNNSNTNSANNSTNFQQLNSKQFSENFWGEKINGFDVLCQNLKHSLNNVKELEQFVRECLNCEDTYGKMLNKLVSQVNKFSSNGTFQPVWSPLKELNEKYGALHVQQVHQLQELIKDIQRYNEELGKRIKKVRENEIQTQNIVQNFQEITQTLNKMKEQYHNLCIEFEKQKKLLDQQQLAQYYQLCQQQQQLSSTNLLALANNSTVSGISQANNPNYQSSLNLQATNGALISSQPNSSNSLTTTTTAFPSAISPTNINTTTNPNNIISNQTISSILPPSNNPISTSNQPLGNVTTTTTTSTTTTTTATTTSASQALTSLATSITANKVTQLLKLEKKLKAALEDYRASLEKYNNIRIEYERKLADSCKNFQYAEETHLKQMRSFVETYSRLMQNINQNKSQAYAEFNSKLSEQFTIDYLVQTFIDNKRTGTERPEPAHFVEQVDYAKSVSATNLILSQMQLQHQHNNNQVSSPVNLLNENEFNLVINGSSNNGSSNNSSLLNTFSNSILPPIPPPLPSNMTSSDLMTTDNSKDYTLFTNTTSTTTSTSNSNTNNNTNNTSLTGQQQRSTPTSFFSASNLYSQLTNSSSTTTLNSINSHVNNGAANVGLQVQNQQQQQQQQQSGSSPNSAEVAAVQSGTVKAESKKSDSSRSGLNIFNVDFLGRKNKKAAAAAAAAAAAQKDSNKDQTNTNTISKSSKFSRNTKKSSKQQANTTTSNTSASTSINQYENLSLNNTNTNNNTSNRDSSSINSEDSNEQHKHLQQSDTTTTTPPSSQQQQQPKTQNNNNNLDLIILPNNGSITARSISSITGSLSFDILDHLKSSNSNQQHTDIDSEGFSIKPPDSSSIGLRRRHNKIAKNNDDMNNFYNSATSTDSSSSSDSDSDDANSTSGPMKVMLTIKPKNEADNQKDQTNTDLLREISKNLQLKPNTGFNLGKLPQTAQNKNKKTYYYNYGTSAAAASNNTTTPANTSSNTTFEEMDKNMPRSYSVGQMPASSSTQLNLSGNISNTSTATNNQTNNNNNNNTSLLDLDFSNITNSMMHTSMSLSKMNNQPNENNSLYNIDEDKEVESSFQYNNSNQNHLLKKSSTTTTLPNINNNPNTNINNNTMNMSIMSNNNPSCSSPAGGSTSGGRFTPACFPGRTTPDFRHSTSLFEQQSTRASIISPLTINGGSEIIPIAVAFTETVHAFFKINEPSKFKLKCFGCMKISFPFAILKLLALELPQLKFNLSQLQIANQDLKLNNQLLIKSSDSSTVLDTYNFEFITQNLINELKQQHQANKLAAFFNFELLKYEHKCGHIQTPPLVLNAQWSSDSDSSWVEINVDYTFAFRKQLSQVNFMLVMPLNSQKYKLTLIKSDPLNVQVQENEDKLQILWQMAALNASGKLQARFSVVKIEDDPAFSLEQFYQPMYVKFHVDNETFSQVKFSILSPNYKLSLLKEKIESGKYFCNFEPQQPQQQMQHFQQSKSLLKSQPSSISVQPVHAQSESPQTVSTTEGQSQNKPNLTGSLSTHIGSSVDVLLNY